MIQNSVVVEELRPDRIGANRFIVENDDWIDCLEWPSYKEKEERK